MKTSQTELDLDKLDEYLSSEASPEDCMQLSDLDGFLTGIAVSPELIKPSEWLPVIWGDDFPDFENAELAEQVYGTIIGRYNEILQSLAADPPQLDPIFWHTDDGVVTAGNWAEGFVDAMSMRADQWGELLDDEEAGLPLIPIIALVSDDDDGPTQIRSSDGELHLNAEIADLIPSSVIEIDAYWKGRREPRRSGTLH